MRAAAAMATHSPSDAVISMFSKSYQYSGKINTLSLIPPNLVIDITPTSENSSNNMYKLPFGTCCSRRSWSVIKSGSIEELDNISEVSTVGEVVGCAVSFPFCN